MHGTEGQTDVPISTVPWRGAGNLFGPTRQKGRVKKRQESTAQTHHQLQGKKKKKKPHTHTHLTNQLTDLGHLKAPS